MKTAWYLSSISEIQNGKTMTVSDIYLHNGKYLGVYEARHLFYSVISGELLQIIDGKFEQIAKSQIPMATISNVNLCMMDKIGRIYLCFGKYDNANMIREKYCWDWQRHVHWEVDLEQTGIFDCVYRLVNYKWYFLVVRKKHIDIYNIQNGKFIEAHCLLHDVVEVEHVIEGSHYVSFAIIHKAQQRSITTIQWNRNICPSDIAPSYGSCSLYCPTACRTSVGLKRPHNDNVVFGQTKKRKNSI